jgi:hypothetical protein
MRSLGETASPSAQVLASGRDVAKRPVPAAWITSRPQVSGEHFPQQVDLSPFRLGAMILCAAGLMVVISSWQTLGELAHDPDPIALGVAGVFPLIGLGLIAAGLVQLYRRQSVTFGETGVEVCERLLTGPRRWSAQYGDYAGVLQREHIVSTKNSSTTYQIIQLLHADPAYDLPLYVDRGDTSPRQRWEALAQRLRLSALHIDDDRIAARPAEALNASLAERVRAGHLTTGTALYDPPPASIKVSEDLSTGAHDLVIAPRRGRVPLAGYGVFAVLPLAFLAMVFVNPGQWPFAAVAVAFLATIAWVRWKDTASPRAIRLTSEAVENRDTWRLNTADAATLNYSEIEAVRIYRSAKIGSLVVAIESDRGTMHLGQGLSRAELVWLRDYLTARIAQADQRRR